MSALRSTKLFPSACLSNRVKTTCGERKNYASGEFWENENWGKFIETIAVSERIFKIRIEKHLWKRASCHLANSALQLQFMFFCEQRNIVESWQHASWQGPLKNLLSAAIKAIQKSDMKSQQSGCLARLTLGAPDFKKKQKKHPW